MSRVAILQYESSWEGRLVNVLQRLGYEVDLIRTAHEIRRAPYVIVPDGDTSTAALKKPVSQDILASLYTAYVEKKPVLGIGRGMFFFCAGHMAKHQAGLGIFDVPIKQFDANMLDAHDRPLATPYCGYGRIAGLHFIEPTVSEPDVWVYFRTQYCVSARVPFAEVAIAHYGVPFAAAVQKEQLTCVNFLPELSGRVGQCFLEAWARRSDDNM